MPKKHPQSLKLVALELLEIYDKVSIVQGLTEIAASTLYRWRDEQRAQDPDLSRRKSFDSPAKFSQHSQSSQYPTDTPENDVEVPQQDVQSEQYSRYQSDYTDHLQEQEAAERAKDRDYREWLAGSDGPDAPPADTKPKEEPLVGIPGKTYPYPLEEDVDPNARFEEFRDLRDMLLNHARTLAADLKPADPDINLRTLALARLLDRVQQLERMLPDLNPERVIRFQQVYCGSVHDVPPRGRRHQRPGEVP